jgi:hypothetical protein
MFRNHGDRLTRPAVPTSTDPASAVGIPALCHHACAGEEVGWSSNKLCTKDHLMRRWLPLSLNPTDKWPPAASGLGLHRTPALWKHAVRYPLPMLWVRKPLAGEPSSASSYLRWRLKEAADQRLLLPPVVAHTPSGDREKWGHSFEVVNQVEILLWHQI